MSEGKGFSGGALIAAFLGGAAAGAAVALLTAPKSGRETRQQIGEYAHHRREDGERIPEAVRAATEAAKQAMKDALSEGGEGSKARAQDPPLDI